MVFRTRASAPHARSWISPTRSRSTSQPSRSSPTKRPAPRVCFCATASTPRLAQDPNAARDVLSFLEKASRAARQVVDLVRACVPVKLPALGVDSGLAHTGPMAPFSKTSGRAASLALVLAPCSALAQADASSFSAALGSGSWGAGAAFFLAGLLLSLTPCALPMAPILWRAVAGPAGSAPSSRARGLALSACFGLGMSLAYAGAGALAAVAGRSFAGALQSPAALLGFGALLFALGLSSLGAFSLRAPIWLESISASLGRKLPGGGPGSACALGALCALVAGPCVAPPLAGALAHIARTGEVAQGAFALFALAWGMCAPIVLLGAGLGAALPKPGPWTRGVQRVLGAALALLGWSVAAPALGPRGSAFALAACLGSLALAAFALARPGGRPRTDGADGQLRAPDRRALAIGAALTLGALVPLAIGAGLAPSWSMPGSSPSSFDRVASIEEVRARAKASGGPTLLEVSANWCAECSRMRAETFPSSVQALAGATLLELDVTSMTDDDQRALSALGLYGPPALVAIPGGGSPERPAASSVGFTDPAKLARMMDLARKP